jgi:hypothetical protein
LRYTLCSQETIEITATECRSRASATAELDSSSRFFSNYLNSHRLDTPVRLADTSQRFVADVEAIEL